MLTSFFTAITGLNNNALTINVIGNNLANINTTAFKASKTSFAELLGGLASTTSSNGNPIQVGLGVFAPGVSPVFNQGSIEHTGRSTDAAISGNGFFIVSTGTGIAFTRAGNFGFSRTGDLLSSDGYMVMGYPATNGVINTNSVLSPITILKGGSLPPKATDTASVTANLNSADPVGSVFSTGLRIFDTLGAPHTLSFVFTKTGPTDWDWEASLPAIDLGGLATDPPVIVGSGSLSFDPYGVLTSPTTNEILTITGFANGAADMDITFEIFDPSGFPRFTTYASESSVSATNQNGYASSVLRDISFDNNGVVSGIFDNGQVMPLAQLALATFPNVEGLLKFKGSTFVAWAASGEPSIGTANTGGRGSVTGASLEQSNVDIAKEFTSLIIAQRGYQANSRVISTTDELYQEAINLKR